MDEALGRLALAQLKAGQPAKGLGTAMSLAARHPKFAIKALATDETVSAMTILGDALVSNNRLRDAIEAYKAAREINRNDTYAAGQLAKVYLATDQGAKALELSDDVAKNPRFRELGASLALSKTSPALLPRFDPESLAANNRFLVVGRPLLVDGAPRVASIAWGDRQWCADLSNQAIRS